jgi:hypothetical protein
MKSKQSVIELAHRTANREGKTLAVLNLNSFSPIYVVRDWDNRLIGQRELVAKIDPVQRPTISEEQAKAITLARYYAKRNVKEEWKRRKIKLSHVDAKDLTKAAIDYLEEHPELIEEAKRSLCST